jgi:hypothetical protein
MHGLFKVAEKEEAGADKISQENFVKIRDGILTGDIFMKNKELTYKKVETGSVAEIKITKWKDLVNLSLKVNNPALKNLVKLKNVLSPKDFKVFAELTSIEEVNGLLVLSGVDGNKITIKNLKTGDLKKIKPTLELLKSTKLALPKNLELSYEQLNNGNLKKFLESVKNVNLDANKFGEITKELINRAIKKSVVLEGSNGSYNRWVEGGKSPVFNNFPELKEKLETIDKKNKSFLIIEDAISNLKNSALSNNSITMSGAIILENLKIKGHPDENNIKKLNSVLKNEKVKKFLENKLIKDNFNDFVYNSEISFTLLEKISKMGKLTFMKNRKINRGSDEAEYVDKINKWSGFGAGDLIVKLPGEVLVDFDNSDELEDILNNPNGYGMKKPSNK